MAQSRQRDQVKRLRLPWVHREKKDGSLQTRCSFCGHVPEGLRRLVAGPGVYLCNQCVDLCREVLGPVGEKDLMPSIPVRPGYEQRRRETRCAFCNSSQDQVRKFVGGPGVYNL